MRVIDVTVQMVVMDHGMNVVTQEILGGPAQHFLRGAVKKGGLAIRIDAVDAFARGIQDQLVLTL